MKPYTVVFESKIEIDVLAYSQEEAERIASEKLRCEKRQQDHLMESAEITDSFTSQAEQEEECA